MFDIKVFEKRVHMFVNGRYVSLTKKISDVEFILWTGKTSRDLSFPIENDLPLNEYKFISLTLRIKGSSNKLPSAVSPCLERYNYLCLEGQNGVMTAHSDTFESIYLELCMIKDVLPLAITEPFFCKNCGIPFIYEEEYCWACKHGI